MLRDYIRLNQSMLVAIAVALPVAATAADIFSDLPAHLNTTYVTIIDYAVYLGVFGAMFYFTNRHRYKTAPDGSRLPADPRGDLKKILASLGMGEVAYGIVRWVLQYYMIEAWGYEPYMSSLVAQVSGIIVYVIIMNVSVKVSRMYADEHR